jgi:hypothetical protein
MQVVAAQCAGQPEGGAGRRAGRLFASLGTKSCLRSSPVQPGGHRLRSKEYNSGVSAVQGLRVATASTPSAEQWQRYATIP